MITASLVKELRDKTGAGMMDCKQALQETDGDIDRAINWLREKGIAKAAKKAGRIAVEGLVKIASNQDTAVLLEMNAETDFVAKNEMFLELLDKTASLLLAAQPADLAAALALDCAGQSLDELIMSATATIGEKISLRRFIIVKKNADQLFGTYTHFDGRIGVIATLEGGNAEIGKDIAMQVASMAPSYIQRADMDEQLIQQERNIQKALMANDESLSSKPENILAGILEGKLSKALQDMCLNDQLFFKAPEIKVGQYLKQNGATCVAFVRYAVGEGLEKKEEDFAAEVASMM